jgi:two-component system LytT family response regulator
MNELKALLIDDERLARRELRTMLAEHAHIRVEGEAGSVESAIEIIHAIKPDVVFLDIQMPGRTGFDLLAEIDVTFKVIFVTAFDAYAIRAFEVNALDYLLKPINPDRLARAIDRLTTSEVVNESPMKRLEYDDRLFLTVDERSVLLKINTIVCITAAGDYSEVITSDGRKSFVLKSLREWETRLPEKFFSRIHRSTIINLEYVEKIEKWFNNAHQVYLRNIEQPLVMSRRYGAKLKTKFG